MGRICDFFCIIVETTACHLSVFHWLNLITDFVGIHVTLTKAFKSASAAVTRQNSFVWQRIKIFYLAHRGKESFLPEFLKSLSCSKWRTNYHNFWLTCSPCWKPDTLHFLASKSWDLVLHSDSKPLIIYSRISHYYKSCNNHQCMRKQTF